MVLSGADKSALYNSVYAGFAGRERDRVITKLASGLVTGTSTVLEAGAGHGHNVPLLRILGFTDDRIYLNEISTDRVASARREFPGVHIYAGDAVDMEFGRMFDFIFLSTLFTSLTDDTLRRRLADKLWSVLKPGGHIIWYDFTFNNPRNPAVRKVTAEELGALFPGARIPAVKRVTLAPPIGRRTGRFYPLFNLWFLRTHIVALLSKSDIR
jgi:SAM-dependent methyltransferase